MADAPDDTPVPRPRPTAGQRLRKIVIVIGLLFVAWIAFAQVIPRGLMGFKAELEGSNKERNSTPPARFNGEMPTAPHEEVLHEKDEQIDAMKTRIDQLEGKLKTLEDNTSASKPAEESAETKAKMEQMQSKIDALLQMPHTSTIEPERVAHMEETISKQQDSLHALQTELTAMHDKSTHDVTVITAFTSLKDAVLRGSSYSLQLMQLSPLVADAKTQDMLAQLKPMAEHGIGTQEQLQAEFQGLLNKALIAGKGNALERNLHSLIRIRKVGEQQTGSDDESVLARSEAKLGRGDIEGSVKENAMLSPPAAALFTAWNTKAQDMLRVRGLLDTLQLALLQEKPKTDMAPAAGAVETPKPDVKPDVKADIPAPVPDAPKPDAKPETTEQSSPKPDALPETKPAPSE